MGLHQNLGITIFSSCFFLLINQHFEKVSELESRNGAGLRGGIAFPVKWTVVHENGIRSFSTMRVYGVQYRILQVHFSPLRCCGAFCCVFRLRKFAYEVSGRLLTFWKSVHVLGNLRRYVLQSANNPRAEPNINV